MKKKIAIIGANGQIGTELCFLLRNDPEIELVPVVRNVLGTAFLGHHGFECTVADICNVEDAKRILKGIDVVVIAAYSKLSAKEGTLLNQKMVEHSVWYSEKHCRVIYFSTVRAYAGKVDTNTPRFAIPEQYDQRKRVLERALFKACRKEGKTGYAFRLGHVYGKRQPRVQNLKSMIAARKRLRLKVDGSKASNVVHTVTIADAVRKCTLDNVVPGLYSLVNAPQWSWRDVFEHYNEAGTELTFEKGKTRRKVSAVSKISKGIWKMLVGRIDVLRGLRSYLPSEVDQKFHRKYLVDKARQDIAAIEQTERAVEMREFAYHPMPGRIIPGLQNTKELLKTRDIPDGIVG